MPDDFPGIDIDRLHDPAIFQAIREKAIARKRDEAAKVAQESAERARVRDEALARGRATQAAARRMAEAKDRRIAERKARSAELLAIREAKAAAIEAKHRIPSDPKPDPYTQIRRMADARKAIEERKVRQELGIDDD